MKFSLLKRPALLPALITLLLMVQSVWLVAQTTYTWKAAAASNDWGTAANWTPAGVPGSTDNVTIVASSNPPVLTTNKTVGIFIISSGSIDLGGNTLAITGNSAFNGGTVTNGTVQPTGTNLTFNGCTFSSSCIVNSSTTNVAFTAGTFNGPATIVKNGTTDNNNAGNCTFNNTAFIRVNAAGRIRLDGNMVFNGTTTIMNDGTDYMLFDYLTPSTFNGDLILYLSGNTAGDIRLAYSGNTIFNGDIYVNSDGTGDIMFCELPTATATLAAGKRILNGSLGFNNGNLRLQRFTQLGSTPQVLNLTGNLSTVTFGPSSTFNGKVKMSAPNFMLSGCVFNNDTVELTKIGTTTNTGLGNNTFAGVSIFRKASTSTTSGFRSNGGNIHNGKAVFINQAGGDILMEFTTGSTYNGEVLAQNESTGSVRLGYAGTTTFNDNIIMNSTAGAGIAYGELAGASVTLASGKTVSLGTSGFTVGTLSFNRFTQSGSARQSLALTGTATLSILNSSTFNGACNFSVPNFNLSASTFNDSLYIQKTGTGNNTVTGGSTFNGVTTINKLTGTGWVRIGGSNIFNSKLHLFNAATAELLLDNVTASTYNGDVTLTNTSTGILHLAYVGSNTFNGNVLLSNSSTGSILFAESANSSAAFNGNIVLNNTSTGALSFAPGAGATATLAAGKTISTGTSGVTAGTILLPRFTQSGSVPVSLSLGAATLTVGPSGIFGGKVNFVAAGITLNGVTFQDSAYIEKTGTVVTGGLGNNVFNGPVTFSKTSTSGAGTWRMGGNNTFNNKVNFQNASSSEIATEYTAGTSTYNDIVSILNTSTGNTRLAYLGTTNFNADVTIRCSSTGGVLFGESTNARANFNGNIVLNNTSTASISFAPSLTAAVTLAAGKTISVGAFGFSGGSLLLPRFTQSGSTPQSLILSGTTTSIVTGPASSWGGPVSLTAPQLTLNGSVFNSTAILQKTGATDNVGAGGNRFKGIVDILCSGIGAFGSGTTNADTFERKLTVTNSGSNAVQLAYTHSNKTTVFADSVILNVTSTGGTSAGIRICEGAATNAFFDGVVIVNNGGSAPNLIRFQNGTSSNATFNQKVFLNSAGSNAASYIRMNNAGKAVYNQNIEVTSPTGGGISFGNGNGSASITPSKTIAVGAAGFSSGTLQVNKLAQTGRNIHSYALTGSAILSVSNSSFDAPVVFTAPQVLVAGDTFYRKATIEKTGITENISAGGNIFNDSALITNSSAGNLRLANATADDYNGVAVFTKTGSGVLDPANNAGSTFASDIVFAGNQIVTVGSGASGSIILDGASEQKIYGNSSYVPVITRLTMNSATGGSATLNVPVNIPASGRLTMTNGILNTSATSLLTLGNAALANIGSSTSYVNGPLHYQMAAIATRTLNFPIGKDSRYRPFELTVVHNAVTAYTYASEMINSSAKALAKTLPATITTVSDISYWSIHRLLTSTMVPSAANLSGNQTVKFYYSEGDAVTDADDLRIVKNTTASPNSWIDIGGVGTAAENGTITSTSDPSAFNSFSDFALANHIGGGNALPVKLISMEANAAKTVIDVDWVTATEIDNKGFEVERSTDGKNFENIGWVDGNGSTTERIDYKFQDTEVKANVVYYYRLNQIDYDGKNERSHISSASIKEEGDNSIAWSKFIPNPASSTAHLVINASLEGAADVNIYDMNGTMVHSTKTNIFHGLNEVNLDLNQLSSGNYMAVVKLASQVVNVKLLLSK